MTKQQASGRPLLTYPILAFAASLWLLLSSCATDLAESARGLLATIPADAEVVGIVDIEKSLDNFKSVKKLGLPGLPSEAMSQTDPAKTGVEPSVMAFFTRGSKIYLTGLIDDKEKFKESIQAWTKTSFKQEGNAEYSVAERGYLCFIRDNQFWIIDRGTPDPAEIAGYTKLSESQSYLKFKENTDALLRFNNDITAIMPLSIVLDSFGDYSKSAAASMALQAVFSAPKQMLLTCDAESDRIVTRLLVTDSKCKPCRFLLPFREIDTNVVKGLNLSAPTFFATGLSAKTFAPLEKIAGSMLNPQIFKNISGTTAAAISSNGATTGVIQTSGPAPELASTLSDMLEVHTEYNGNSLAFNKGQLLPGKITSAEAANRFKGAYLGICLSTDDKNNLPLNNISYVTLLLKKVDDSAGFFLTIELK